MSKPLKYRNVPVEIGGIRYASKAEARRGQELRLMERAGYISNLQRQVPFALTVNGVAIGKYVADYTYERVGALVVEDVKSKVTVTDLFRWKAKHMLAEHGIKIEVVGK